jgi:hypothetical protein
LPPHQVDEEYLEALLLLGRKIAFISTNNAAAGSAAAKEVAAVLEKLRIRAIIKVGGCDPRASSGSSADVHTSAKPPALTLPRLPCPI